MIHKLKDATGAWKEGSHELNPLISQYFAGLFSTEVDEPDPDILTKVNPRVTDLMNEGPLNPCMAEEVKSPFCNRRYEGARDGWITCHLLQKMLESDW